MSPVRLKDLGPAARAQIEAMVQAPPKAKRNQRVVTGTVCPYICECGAHFDDWPVTERHMTAEHHTRAGIDLERLNGPH